MTSISRLKLCTVNKFKTSLRLNLFYRIVSYLFITYLHISARFFAYQILTAIKYLHKRDVVHCDLKPENILLLTSNPNPAQYYDPQDPTFYPHQVNKYRSICNNTSNNNRTPISTSITNDNCPCFFLLLNLMMCMITPINVSNSSFFNLIASLKF